MTIQFEQKVSEKTLKHKACILSPQIKRKKTNKQMITKKENDFSLYEHSLLSAFSKVIISLIENSISILEGLHEKYLRCKHVIDTIINSSKG